MLYKNNNLEKVVRKKRKILFALIPVLVLLGGLSFVLSDLEEKEIIQTQRPDDRVVHIPGDFLKEKNTPQGIVYVIDEPDMIPSEFRKEKTENTFRIVMTGGSFAMGSPYVFQKRNRPTHGGIPDWVSARLSFMYPSKKIEMINAAAGAQNSDRVEKIVIKMVATKPDLMIVAIGNNEGYVPATRLNEALHKWIVYRVMKKALIQSPESGKRPYFAPQDENPDKIEMNFEKNIDRIIEHCRKSKTPLILCTLPINYTYEMPAQAKDSGSMEIDDNMRKGKIFYRNGQFEKAKKALLKSENIGLASYYLAKMEQSEGNFELARDLFRVYVQQVPLNRTRPSLNNMVRKKVAKNSVLLVDLEKAIDRLSQNNIADPSYFADYCHLTLKGYYLLSEVVVDEIRKNKMIKGDTSSPEKVPNGYEMIRALNWDMYQIGFTDGNLKDIFEIQD